MTRTDATPGTPLTTQVRAHRNRTSDCHCGQQLDHCSRAHCPRCGRSLSRS